MSDDKLRKSQPNIYLVVVLSFIEKASFIQKAMIYEKARVG